MIQLSIVIPVYNEEHTIGPLAEQLRRVLDELGRPYELVWVDDGSTDRSGVVLDGLAERDPEHVRVVHFRRNFGKCAALVSGFRRAQGQVIVTMDADLQDDPAEIPRFLSTLAEGYDLVSGWKVRRQDPWSKRLPSKLFNAVTARLTGLRLHDFNCGFKCYRREAAQHLRLHGRLYRFIPVLVAAQGFRVTEMAVQHHPRRAGVSKFGAARLLDGFFDLLTVLLITRYLQRPLHLLGLPGVFLGGIGLAICSYLSVLWFQGVRIGHRPLLTLGVLCVMLGMQFLSIGLVGEMLAWHMRQQDSGIEPEASEPGRAPGGALSRDMTGAASASDGIG